jgi:hypothetical protein
MGKWPVGWPMQKEKEMGLAQGNSAAFELILKKFKLIGFDLM